MHVWAAEHQELQRPALPRRPSAPASSQLALAARALSVQTLDEGSLLALQRVAGNAAAGLLVQRCGCAGCDGCGGGKGEMELSQPGDPVEREADAMADLVGATVQRKGEGSSCDSAPADDDPQAIASAEEEQGQADGGAMMAKATDGHVQRLHPGRQAALTASLGQGSRLPAGVRRSLEPHFGHGFGDVLVHADGLADSLGREMGAEAFTTGRDVYFRAGRYAPDTEAGRRLLAHELTHVVQQRRAPARPVVSRYTLAGFSTADQASMNAAVPKASSTVKSCKPSATCVASAIDSKDYVYQEDLGACGWTYPMSGTIKIGKSAFNPSVCCALESTVAHEASHTCFYTEGGARKLECDCFSCSCNYGK